MRYYIADNHFFHEGLLNRMDKRGFNSVDEMNEYMIQKWNERVKKNDEVVILGDLSLGKAKETNEIAKRLNGRLYLCIGNHDKYLSNKEFDTKRFKNIAPYIEMNDAGRKVICCHYPIMCYNGQFRRDTNGNPSVFMLHGHIHATEDIMGVEAYKDFVKGYPRATRHNDEPKPAPVQMINCFCMFSDYIPLTLDEWIALENAGKLGHPDMDWKYSEKLDVIIP